MAKKIKQYKIKKMSLGTKILFFEQFKTYISSSIPISTSLTNISRYTDNSTIKLIAKILLKEMDNGVNLSDAILKFKDTIGSVYCNLISLGAQAGELPQILDDIYKSLKRQQKIRLNILKQLAYPAFLLFGMLVPSVAILGLFIAPRFAKLHETMSGSIPSNISNIQQATALFQANWVFILIFTILIIWGGITLFKKIIKSKIGLQLPIINAVVRNYNLSMFTRLLAISYTAGIPITHGILLASEAVPNEYMKKILYKCSSMITKHPFTETFASTRFFSPSMITKIQTGELTGELDKLLREISNDIDNNLEAAVSALLKLVEPTLMIIIAIFIAIYGTSIMSTIY